MDADIVSEEDVEYESINAGRLLNGLEMVNNGLNLVILDACRNNPYARSFRSSTRGLNRMQPASGSLIMYATEPGNVASDGSGGNGVFTTHLVDAINQQGKKIEEVFKITAINVSRATGKKQTPYIEGVILGDFYFSDDGRVESTATKSPVISSDGSGEHERLFWNSVIADPSTEMFQAYLEQYPSGNYARLAEIKLEQLVSNDTAVTGHQIAKLVNPAVEKNVNQPASGPATNGFDVSGSYTSIMKSRRWKETPRVVLTQIGDKIQGVLIPDKGYGLEGKIKDNIIEFTYFAQFAPITGTWKISDDGTTLSGDWEPNTGSNYGTWELIKIGDKAVAE